MKKLAILLLCLFAASRAQAKVHTFQVTIGASATAIVPVSSNLWCKWVVFQNNNATDSMVIGDSLITTTRGMKLVAGASFYQGALPNPAETNLSGWYVTGTQNDVIDVIYDDGQ